MSEFPKFPQAEADELLKELANAAKNWMRRGFPEQAVVLQQAIAALRHTLGTCTRLCNIIEKLDAENKKLKAERDAAIADLKDFKDCSKCLNTDKSPFIEPCSTCNGEKWEWRGIKKETEP